MAGEWLVGLAPGWEAHPPSITPILVEHNLLTGAEPIHIPLPPEADYLPGLTEFSEIPPIAAVEEDGTVFYLTSTGRHVSNKRFTDSFTLWRVSPYEPTPRPIATPPINPEGANSFLQGHRMFLAAGHLAIAEVEPGAREVTAVAVMQTNGTFLGRLADRTMQGFAYNGETVLTTTTPCSESFLETWTPGSPPPSHPTGPCPAPLISHQAKLTRHGVQVTLECPPEPPLGCFYSEVWVTAMNLHGLDAFSGPLSILPGKRQIVTVALDRAERRWLGRHRHSLVKLTAYAISGYVSGVPEGERHLVRVHLH